MAMIERSRKQADRPEGTIRVIRSRLDADRYWQKIKGHIAHPPDVAETIYAPSSRILADECPPYAVYEDLSTWPGQPVSMAGQIADDLSRIMRTVIIAKRELEALGIMASAYQLGRVGSMLMSAHSSVQCHWLRHITQDDYYRTIHWQIEREGALHRANHRCQLCSETAHLQVHHNDYQRLGREAAEDMIVLCDPCHARHHHKLPRWPERDARDASSDQLVGLALPRPSPNLVARVRTGRSDANGHDADTAD